MWFGDGNYLLWSDIPNDRILRWIPGLGVSVFRKPAGNTNGHTRDREGRLVSCSHGNRHVERTEHDGTITVLADSYDGKRLNSPNDVVVKSDGTIWFTDPAYGIETRLRGPQEPAGAGRLLRLLPRSHDREAQGRRRRFRPAQRARLLARRVDPLRRRQRASATAPTGPHHIRVVQGGRRQQAHAAARSSSTINPGLPDGFRLDADGNIWTSAGDGVHVYSTAGDLLAKINMPKACANVTWGGTKNNWLFIACTDSMFLLHTMTNGARRPG